MRFGDGNESSMSNGRINRRRARATRPENNKIYILICARILATHVKRIPSLLEEKGTEGNGQEKGDGLKVDVCHAANISNARERMKSIKESATGKSMNKFAKCKTCQKDIINRKTILFTIQLIVPLKLLR